MKNLPTTDREPTSNPHKHGLPHKHGPLDVVRLNQQAAAALHTARPHFADWSIAVTQVAGAEVLDFRSPACPAAAGQLLARVSSGAELEIDVEPAAAGAAWQWEVVVRTAEPLPACLGAQYAGWPLSCGQYFAMVSGPIRGARGREPLFQHFQMSLV